MIKNKAEKSFDETWEKNVYSKGKQTNLYPYDILVSIVARNFFSISKEKRSKIRVWIWVAVPAIILNFYLKIALRFTE